MSGNYALDKSGAEINSAINQQYDGNPAVNVGYDDIQGSLAGAKQSPSASPTWREYDFGISGGVDFWVQGFDIGNSIDISIQTPHAMKLSTVLENHLHGILPTAPSAGDKVQWQIDVIAAGVGGVFAVPTGSPFTSGDLEPVSDAHTRHNLMEIAEIPAANTTVSSIYMIKLTRIAATGTDYSGEVYLLFNDSHFQQDQSRGSRSEYVK